MKTKGIIRIPVRLQIEMVLMCVILGVQALVQEDIEKKIDLLARRLGSEDYEERRVALEELKRLCSKDSKTARRSLRNRMQGEQDLEITTSLKQVLDILPILQLKLEIDGESRVGQTVKLRVRLKNISDENQVVVPALHMSEWVRCPKYTIRIAHFDGQPVQGLPELMGYRGVLLIRKEDFVTLKPDEELDPFDRYKPWYLDWKPPRPGDHSFKMTVDFSREDERGWNDPAEPSELPDDVRKVASRVKRIKVHAEVKVKVVE